jgi:hypothetical protein
MISQSKTTLRTHKTDMKLFLFLALAVIACHAIDLPLFVPITSPEMQSWSEWFSSIDKDQLHEDGKRAMSSPITVSVTISSPYIAGYDDSTPSEEIYTTDQPPVQHITPEPTPIKMENDNTAGIVMVSVFSGLILLFIFSAIIIYLYKMGRFNLLKLWCGQCIGKIKSKLPHRYNQVAKHEQDTSMIQEEEP